jgi:hypothetical protein
VTTTAIVMTQRLGYLSERVLKIADVDPALSGSERASLDNPYVLGNLSGGPLWTSGVLDIINRPMRRVGLKIHGVGGHAYRRAFNGTLRKNARGCDLERRIIIGHSIEDDINASRYSTVTIPEFAEVVRQAYTDDPILPGIPRRRRVLGTNHLKVPADVVDGRIGVDGEPQRHFVWHCPRSSHRPPPCMFRIFIWLVPTGPRLSRVLGK